MSMLHLALATANLALCSAIAWTCMCRMNMMQGDTTRFLIRAGYVLLFTAAAASGLSPILFREWPTAPQVALTAAFAMVLAAGAPEWKFGLPFHAQSQRHARRASPTKP